jgi:hypothetical protein
LPPGERDPVATLPPTKRRNSERKSNGFDHNYLTVILFTMAFEASPFEIEWLIVVKMVRLRFGIAAKMAWLAFKFAVTDGIGHGLARPVFLRKA